MKLSLPSYLIGLLSALLIFPVFCVGTAYFYTRSQPRVYSSSALIKFNHFSGTSTGFLTQSEKQIDPIDLQTEFEIIQSKKILSPILSEQNFEESWTAEDGLSVETFKEKEDYVYNRFKAQHLRVQPYRNTRLIELTVFSTDPKQAKTLANTIARNHIAYRNSEAENILRLELVSEAEEAQTPIKPNLKLNMALSLVIGFFLGGIAALLFSLWYFLTRKSPPSLPQTSAT